MWLALMLKGLIRLFLSFLGDTHHVVFGKSGGGGRVSYGFLIVVERGGVS